MFLVGLGNRQGRTYAVRIAERGTRHVRCHPIQRDESNPLRVTARHRDGRTNKDHRPNVVGPMESLESDHTENNLERNTRYINVTCGLSQQSGSGGVKPDNDQQAIHNPSAGPSFKREGGRVLLRSVHMYIYVCAPRWLLSRQVPVLARPVCMSLLDGQYAPHAQTAQISYVANLFQASSSRRRTGLPGEMR